MRCTTNDGKLKPVGEGGKRGLQLGAFVAASAYPYRSDYDSRSLCALMGGFGRGDRYWRGSDGAKELRRCLDGIREESHFRCFLESMQGNFAFIYDSKEVVLLSVDRIRSYPVFVSFLSSRFSASFSSMAMRELWPEWETDEIARLEFLMAGYVTGANTLCKGIQQLRAGEAFMFRRDDGSSRRIRYYQYAPKPVDDADPEFLKGELSKATNTIFEGLHRRVGNRSIWVPLSGGLDSRLVVFKLKEFGFKSVRTFSYGPKGNMEAKVARRVSDRLGIPWYFVESTRSRAKRFHGDSVRQSYWRYSHGLCAVPFTQDIDVLHNMMKKGVVSGDAVIINGNSGDFISGGHIQSELSNCPPTVDGVAEVILRKHYSLWRSKQNGRTREIVKPKLVNQLENADGREWGPNKRTQVYETWEWEERQSKYVVNGQRTYDFLGLDWELPLWDKLYLDFWAGVSWSEKMGQRLYRRYLCVGEFGGLFTDIPTNPPKWYGLSSGIPLLAKGIRLAFGRPTRDLFVKYGGLLGYYGYQYGAYSWPYVLRNLKDAKHLVAFDAKACLMEEGFEND